MAVILDSRQICGGLERKIRKELCSVGKVCLASVAIGKDYAAGVYRSSQKKAAIKLGIEYRDIDLPADISTDEFKGQIDKLNKDNAVTGIILNKPFPLSWKDSEVFSLLDEKKDVEGMHPFNLGKFFMGEDQLRVSPTVLSVIELIKKIKIDLCGKKVTVVGFSPLIGRPLAFFLGSAFATVSITHIETYKAGDLPSYVKNADIVISAAGKPGLIKGKWIKKGAVVIDVGTGQKEGRLSGDVDFDAAEKRASYITPVPGGIGRLTTMFLYYNLISAAKQGAKQ